MTLEGCRFGAPKLAFDPEVPSKVDISPFRGLKLHGPYDASQVALKPQSIAFLFPKHLQAKSHALARYLIDGIGGYPGFKSLFGMSLTGNDMQGISFDVPANSRPAQQSDAYRQAISDWHQSPGGTDPHLVVAVVPHTDRWDTSSPYYAVKGEFARLGIPSQMVTTELLGDQRRLEWSVANIALATFAKLGGTPWVVQSPANHGDVVLGVGRADIRTRSDNRRRTFGYAISFSGNGHYRHSWSFPPVADESEYEQSLENSAFRALQDFDGASQPPTRLIIHLAKKAGRKEIDAVESAVRRSAFKDLPVAFLRLDDSSLFELFDTASNTFSAPKGLFARLGPGTGILQVEEVSNLGTPRGGLYIHLDRRSTVDVADFEELASHAYRLAYASWRGFNAKAKPVTLLYGEKLAELVGYLDEGGHWQNTMRRSLLDTPWFL